MCMKVMRVYVWHCLQLTASLTVINFNSNFNSKFNSKFYSKFYSKFNRCNHMQLAFTRVNTVLSIHKCMYQRLIKESGYYISCINQFATLFWPIKMLIIAHKSQQTAHGFSHHPHQHIYVAQLCLW